MLERTNDLGYRDIARKKDIAGGESGKKYSFFLFSISPVFYRPNSFESQKSKKSCRYMVLTSWFSFPRQGLCVEAEHFAPRFTWHKLGSSLTHFVTLVHTT